jgi:hypothetical protein
VRCGAGQRLRQADSEPFDRGIEFHGGGEQDVPASTGGGACRKMLWRGWRKPLPRAIRKIGVRRQTQQFVVNRAPKIFIVLIRM